MIGDIFFTLDYLLYNKTSNNCIDLRNLWNLVINGFNEMWPSRLTIQGTKFADVWQSDDLSGDTGIDIDNTDILVPFHKLSQWLTYSLLEPIEKIIKVEILNTHLLTGLPEYRNGILIFDIRWAFC